jgi:hypothetical protein
MASSRGMALAPLKHDVGDGFNTRDLETIIPGCSHATSRETLRGEFECFDRFIH